MMLNERSQRQNATNYMSPFDETSRIDKAIETERTLMVVRGWKKGENCF